MSATPFCPGCRADEDDAEWFKAHPKRSYRLRAAVVGEWLTSAQFPPEYELLTLTRKVEAGVRQRLPLALHRDVPIADTDEFVKTLFAVAVAADRTGAVLTFDFAGMEALDALLARKMPYREAMH